MIQPLVDKFPDAFDRNDTRPLKVGIHADIAAATDWSSAYIYEALRRYCHSKTYRHAIVASGSQRINLQGDVVANIPDDERNHARRTLGLPVHGGTLKLKRKPKP